MSRTDNEVIGLYHGYLNLIHAYMQGYYSRLSVWVDLVPSEETTTLREEAAMALDFLIPMYRELWSGRVIDLQHENSEQVAFLDGLVQAAFYYYDTAPAKITELIVTPPSECGAREVGEFIGFFADQAYSRQHFVKGLISYGECYNLPDVADRWRQHLLPCQEEIHEANTYFAIAKEGARAPTELMAELQNGGLLLPGILRCKGSDLRHLEAKRRDNMSYETMLVPGEEVEQWEALGFNPVSAAAWRAYGFYPHEAADWLESGFFDPGWAAAYWLRGLNKPEATEWCSKGVNAAQAAALEAEGISAAQYIEH